MNARLKQSIEANLARITQQWIGSVFLIGAVLFMLFGIIDYFVTPENFKTFLLYRIITATILIMLLLINRLRRGTYYQYFLLLFASVLSAATIELMALSFGGYRSPYYVAINIVIISALGFIPINVLHSAIILIIIYGISLIPVLSPQALTDPVFLSNNGIMISIFVIVLALRWQNQKLIVNELTLRETLEQEKEKLLRAAKELKESNEELKTFAHVASHDLRTPLVNMKGFAGELRHTLQEINSVISESLPDLRENNRTRLLTAFLKDIPEALGFIDSSVGRMDELINAISKLSRLGRQELKPELIKAQAAVQSVLKDLHHVIETRGITVKVGPLPEIVADRDSLLMILGNILDNAVKYLRPGVPGEIEIIAETNSDGTAFSIRDNGRGIPNDEIPKAFEMFRRVGEQDVPGEGGGLACVKTLVRRHGGRIWCESKPRWEAPSASLFPRITLLL
jgi:signal transduction histidine kinase